MQIFRNVLAFIALSSTGFNTFGAIASPVPESELITDETQPADKINEPVFLGKRTILGDAMLSQGGVVVTYGSSAATLLLAMVCPGVTQVYAACAGLAAAGLAASSFGMALNTAGFFIEFGDALAPALGYVLGKEEDHVVNDQEFDHYKEIWGDEIDFNQFYNVSGDDFESQSLDVNDIGKRAFSKVELLKEITGIDTLSNKVYDISDQSVNAEDIPESPFIEKVWEVSPRLRQGDGYRDRFIRFFQSFKANPTILIYKSIYGVHVSTPISPLTNKRRLIKSIFNATPSSGQAFESFGLVSNATGKFTKGIKKVKDSYLDGFITLTLDVSEKSADFWGPMLNSYFEKEHSAYTMENFAINGAGALLTTDEASKTDDGSVKVCGALFKGDVGPEASRLHTLKHLLRTQAYFGTYGPIDPGCHSLFG